MLLFFFPIEVALLAVVGGLLLVVFPLEWVERLLLTAVVYLLLVVLRDSYLYTGGAFRTISAYSAFGF